MANAIWRGAGVADRAGLENRCGRKLTEGSNPSLSAFSGLAIRRKSFYFHDFHQLNRPEVGVDTVPPSTSVRKSRESGKTRMFSPFLVSRLRPRTPRWGQNGGNADLALGFVDLSDPFIAATAQALSRFG